MRIVEFKPLENTSGHVTGYLHTPLSVENGSSNYQYPSVVICPGGAYAFVSDREGDPVALEYLAAGYQVFILNYSVDMEAKDFVPLMELSKTVMMIREHAVEWSCMPDKIAVCGFSAGGHLACSLATLWNHPELTSRLDTKGGMNRPDAGILCYPVITSNEFGHHHSISNVSGKKQGEPGFDFFSLEHHVSAETCQLFIWHTASDTCVPVENSLLLAFNLQKQGIPYECHIFPTGAHGLSVCTNETRDYDPYASQWMKLSKNWLSKVFAYIQ